MNTERNILLSYYGDDFTGSADVLESLSLMGIPTVLFLEAPSSTTIKNFNWKCSEIGENDKIAFGVAGISRSLNVSEMLEELDPIFNQISKIPSRFFHYKICSTLDSSPEVGNIGTALELAEKYFPSAFIPMVVGLPALNRFVVFGNLFARIDKETYRLDRHPVMSKHPITPMSESDIRLHLAKQTDRKMGLVDYLALERLKHLSVKDIIRPVPDNRKAPLILFDTLVDKNLSDIGKWIGTNSQSSHQLLLGSSAIEYALGNAHSNKTLLKNETMEISPTLIVAGSCSQTTADQLNYVANLGHVMIPLNVAKLFEKDQGNFHVNEIIENAIENLNTGKNVAIYSAMGPKDPMMLTIDKSEQASQPHRIATSQAKITKSIINRFPLKRLVTAGGDTSGYILKELEIKALEFKNVIAVGAPLCIAHSDIPAVDGLEIAVKGGQNGTVKYFEFAQKGGIN